MFFCVLILCTFDYDVVTAVCQLLINGYVMLCYVISVVFSVVSCESGQNAPTIFIRKSQNAPNVAKRDVLSGIDTGRPISAYNVFENYPCLIYRPR